MKQEPPPPPAPPPTRFVHESGGAGIDVALIAVAAILLMVLSQ